MLIHLPIQAHRWYEHIIISDGRNDGMILLHWLNKSVSWWAKSRGLSYPGNIIRCCRTRFCYTGLSRWCWVCQNYVYSYVPFIWKGSHTAGLRSFNGIVFGIYIYCWKKFKRIPLPLSAAESKCARSYLWRRMDQNVAKWKRERLIDIH